MRLKRNIVLALTLAVGLMVVGCGKKDSVDSDATSSASKKESVDSSANVGSSDAGADDVTENKETEEKKEDTISEDVEFTDKVVASSVAVVQILDALGVPMVGVPTSSYELPESVAYATRIGNAMTPDLEVIASLNPSVIVSVDSLSADLKAQFDTLKIESAFVDLASYDGLKEAITSLSKRFNVEAKAEELIASFEEREGKITSMIDGKEGPSVLIIFGAGTSFMVASESSYVGDLAKRVGAKNIIEDAKASFTPVDMEYLADKNPDYILFMAHANPEESLVAFRKEFETNAAWQNFDAVKNDKVYALETSYFGMSANLLAVDAMEKLVEIIYAE